MLTAFVILERASEFSGTCVELISTKTVLVCRQTKMEDLLLFYSPLFCVFTPEWYFISINIPFLVCHWVLLLLSIVGLGTLFK